MGLTLYVDGSVDTRSSIDIHTNPPTQYKMFLDHLRCAKPNNSHVMESFDVSSLYTNVSNDSAVQAIFELLTENGQKVNMYGFTFNN
ncbi:hypothetical protein KIN20_018715 [Parelaphostrongylus tenuis]|uniref:Reverse transcriptase domain-containing protein n=1 Tax=Parelaphostrongylus tenuis TaxID=148309 RepID=A0AAD5QPT3_PARTN|nr:hypothetical protein KIN20_018715 [Parelaphostrongylus tenuis]